ncbi:pyrroloquinoline quinone biosynthesis protein PqqE [Acidisphaera rubrifaciens]|uniref:PqqA peptide cyclase n=1 Tax=Acidisphaera rubrifaciens HS-AP3 TaxID=1231350 RepID=A0A0D6P205_9PROT|nr:pyrroloquinoline quinone biosynthesis protein PqqE [Acidisphaera rubrifaciens]GAN75785.1 pyrroloquinoline quinone (PQQ) biosynthesis protein PqqE [Acidisphaera rubrifaciens HS-AP3]
MSAGDTLAAPQPVAAPVIRAPLGLLAELTHRCPLACPYCSNPLALEDRAGELDTAAWTRVFNEAAELGVLQTHLSGGEPLSRRDILALVAAAHDAGLYTNLITSAIGLDAARVAALRDAGLDHVQISLQDTVAGSADVIAGYDGAHARKLAAAAAVRDAGLALTVNAVIHRANIERLEAMVDMAAALGAGRVEVAHAQYYGWALRNRAALMPTRAQVEVATATLARLRESYDGRLVIDAVVPDYYARYPKPCMGGWASRSLNITPSGRALPCHAAETIPGLEFWNVRDHSVRDIWLHAPSFNAFRGTDWMAEPCRSCARRDVDFGGCRCQALAIAGDATATDPACALSPLHDHLLALAEADAQTAEIRYAYRGRREPAAG